MSFETLSPIAAMGSLSDRAGEMTEGEHFLGWQEDKPSPNPRKVRKCARCGAQPYPVHLLLDTRKGKEVLLLRCECGERMWED
jgi:hypothetical protein